jgi:hypothetical protein
MERGHVGESVKERGWDGDGEYAGELGGVTGSRSVTRRIVKRGGMVLDGGVIGQGEQGYDVTWGVLERGGRGEWWGVSGVGRVSSWKDVERMDERALTRLVWQKVSEFESGSEVDDGACGGGGVEVNGVGLSEGGGME